MWNIQKSFLWQFSWFRLKWWKQLIKRADSVSYKWEPRSRLLGTAPHITQLFSKWSQWNLDLRSTTSSKSLFHSEIVFPCECVCTQINLSVWAFMFFSLTQGFIVRFYSIQFFIDRITTIFWIYQLTLTASQILHSHLVKRSRFSVQFKRKNNNGMTKINL